MSAGERLVLGVVCFPTLGGSGVIATEIALGMARRGHRVHLFAYERPVRLAHLEDVDGVVFHRVVARAYPVMQEAPYTLALASRIAEVARQERMDVLHVHYAVPHAVSAYLARQMLGGERPRLVTTLHGTDVTLVGSDPAYRPVTRFAVAHSDYVTVPSQWLAERARELLELAEVKLEVIPNFVDVARFAPVARADAAEATLVHVSNFRAVKHVPDVVAVFAELRRLRPGRRLRLVLVGDGPERGGAEALAERLGVRPLVDFVGERDDVREVLARADLFLMPSESESFGVAALEAQAMGVPVIASRVGGLPEVIADGETGVLLPVGDVPAMGAAVAALLDDPPRLAAMRRAARQRAVARFEMNAILDRYEALYATVSGVRHPYITF